MPRLLYVKTLRLQNFKGIAKLDLEFDESLTLLVGVNGVGKTSILQALLAAVTYIWGTGSDRSYPRFRFSENVLRVGTSTLEGVIELATSDQPPVGVGFKTKDPNHSLYIEYDSHLDEFLERMPKSLPLVVYYEQNRSNHKDGRHRGISISSEENRASSLNTAISSPLEFKTWFFEKEADEGQEIRERKDLKYEDLELAKIRKMLKHLDGFTAVRSRKTPNNEERNLFLEKDGADIPFDSLSGGEQAFFLLAADLARRLMLAFPNMDIAEAPGIVCIDEIELHLHPAWQRRILGTLMKTFPACQFVVSTHSPQIVGSVEAQHVRLLTPVKNGIRKVSQPIATKGRDSNFVLEGIFDTPDRDDDASRLFDEFDRLVDQGELGAAERVLDKLGEAVEGQSSAVAIRQAKLNRLRRASE